MTELEREGGQTSSQPPNDRISMPSISIKVSFLVILPSVCVRPHLWDYIVRELAFAK